MSNELPKNFDHQHSEPQWYEHWLSEKYFFSNPDSRPSYTVVIPPPNVTGVLHMGHCLNNTIQDILVRRARQLGFNACWVPGTDHASIATEAKVVQMLREKGISKSSIGREAFLEHAWEWKEKYGGIILQQLKKLGCSLDWNRVNFTMDPDYYKSVIAVFIDLHGKGLIYRGKRMINWDPKALTALSDEEVIFKETQSKLYHLQYKVVNKDGSEVPGTEGITIATVRPETILGDTAIAVNPTDSRYMHLHGKYALVPLINRLIPIITDDYVAVDFGTGALKVTPAHDMNDNLLGEKHGLEVIDIMNDDGTFSEAAQLYIGLDRFEVRKKIVPDLEAAGHLVKMEDYTNQVGYSERSNAVVEPRLSLQWWVKMAPLTRDALAVVENGEIQFHPAKFKNLYRHWMSGIKDWCISRQLWWGQRIPAWYDADGNYYVAATEEEALGQYFAKRNVTPDESAKGLLTQDPDCLDTWFSSWLWPFEVFKGHSHPGNTDIKYYYPTATLVTAPEIIFFWVARMIMAGLEYQQQIPFKDVYFTGIVRDKQGRKMSKSLGNSPDLLALIDQYGADAVRFGILISSPAGNDILFDESSLEQGRNFNNKLWNALKLITLWKDRGVAEQKTDAPDFANVWFDNRLRLVTNEIDNLLKQFRLSEALKTLYSLIWDDYCSWYLEWIKPPYGELIDAANLRSATGFLEKLMTILHPFMPFITEEIYHRLADRSKGDDLCIKLLETGTMQVDAQILASGELLKNTITATRDARNKHQLKPKEPVDLFIQSATPQAYKSFETILARQTNSQILYTDTPVSKAITIALEKDKLFLVAEQPMNSAGQKEALLIDLEYQRKFLESVTKKLGNERFVQNAKPEIVAIEQKKQADTLARIKNIEESLAALL